MKRRFKRNKGHHGRSPDAVAERPSGRGISTGPIDMAEKQLAALADRWSISEQRHRDLKAIYQTVIREAHEKLRVLSG